MAPVNESLRPAAKTATKATSPTPIMRAAAVAAVRAVLRVALARARCPVVARQRSIGAPMHAGERPHDEACEPADPEEHQQRAEAEHLQRLGGAEPAGQSVDEQDEADDEHQAGQIGREVAEAPRGGWRPPGRRRSVAPGGAQGRRTTAATVTSTPTSRAATIVRGPPRSPRPGRPKPMASNSRRIPQAMPMPATSPATDAITPTTRASPTTLAITCPTGGPERPRGFIRTPAHALGDGDREGVEDDERATKSATKAKASRAGVGSPDSRPRCRRSAPARSRLRSRPAGRRGGGADGSARSLSLIPGSAVAKTLETWSSRSNQRWASPRVTRTTVAPPIDSTSP